MLSSPYFTRLAAATAAGLLLSAVLMNARVLTAAPKPKPMAASAYASKECAIGEAVLATGFAPQDQVLSLSPIGPPVVKGEAPPAPLLRAVARSGERLAAQAPAKGEIVAVSRTDVIADGRASASWSVAMIPCADHIVVYRGLETLDGKILRRLGAAAQAKGDFVRDVRFKVAPGDPIGVAHSVEIGLYASEKLTARKSAASADGMLAPPEAAARCPIDNLKRTEKPVWQALFGDAQGKRLPAAGTGCATARMAAPVAAQGLWLTDPGHGARTNKLASASLTTDIAVPDRLVFSFFGRLNSLDAAMFDGSDASVADGYLTAMRGRERINAPFAELVPDASYCYENLRAGLDGPAMKGVVLLRLSSNAAGATILKAEAIPAVKNCESLREPWSFTGAETAFFRPSEPSR